ncbi:MAG: GNAT family N-acetyltransferase [Firmicutes bacterium]|nr:GNAT family N-acetyltransferase [Bacillota bacterium]
MIVIEEARSLKDLNEVERLQAETWSPSVVVPSELMLVAAETGGTVLVARAEGRIVGFCLGFAAWDGREAWLWSHMAAVEPAYQSRGVGAALKLRQREVAREKGYRVVTWTFDPLQAGNANFNIVKLGALARTFLPNHYGFMDDPLNRGLPSDRLLAEWWVDGAAGAVPRVDGEPVVFLAARRRDDGLVAPDGDAPAGGGRLASGGSAAPAGPCGEDGGVPGDGRKGGHGGDGAPTHPLIRPARAPAAPVWPERPWRLGFIEIPLHFQELKAADTDLALAWRQATAAAFQKAFSLGAVVCGFRRDAAAGVGRYEFILGGAKL